MHKRPRGLASLLNPSRKYISPPPLSPSLKPPTLKKCVALLRLSKSIRRIKQIHAHSIRTFIPLSHPDFAKHLIFSLFSFPSSSFPLLLRYAHRIFTQLHNPNTFTVNTMIRAYADSPDPLHALLVFTRSLTRPDTHTYPFLLKACSKLSLPPFASSIHSSSIKNSLFSTLPVQNSLIHFYSSCGALQDAYRLFDEMPHRNLVSWNSIINSFVTNGRPSEALTHFQRMQDEGIEPDGFTVVSLLSACAELGTLALGRRAHAYSLKTGLSEDQQVGNSLIDLYAKCGSINGCRKLFDEMGSRNAVSWTSLIVALAANGFGKEALEVFTEMERDGLQPTEITMIGVLYACSHCGLVGEGFKYFEMMKEYGMVPKIEHYGCMVDLLGRAGKVEEAREYIVKMPLEPNAVVWRTLLGACAVHKRLEIGEEALSNVEKLDPGHNGDYVLLSNLYASVGRWRDVQKLRRDMVRRGVKKNPGCSLLELGNHVHEFVMGDQTHPHSDEIYEKLDEIAKRLRKEGYVPKTSNILADIEE